MTDLAARLLANKLTRADRRRLMRASTAWRRKMHALIEAVRESERITSEDLAVRILPVPEDQ